MISIPKFLERSAEPVVRFVGLGNAGVNLVDRVIMSGLPGVEAVAMNSDLQSLSSSVVPVKVTLGPLATRGLGAGGDPEIGLDAARESLSEIEEAMAGADLVFLCGGLGGGTASGAMGTVAEIAKQNGSLLIAVVTSPFAFEGRRRASQAAVALQEVSEHADAVIHFENDRMAELTAPRSGVAETFSACDALLGGCISALVRLLSASGPLAVGLPDLLTVLKARNAESFFGTGASSGDNRAHEALEQALRSPLLDRGRLLGRASNLLVHVSGPEGLSFAEVQTILQEIGRQVADSAFVHLGVSTTNEISAPLVVTLLGKCGALEPVEEIVRVPAPVKKAPPVTVRDPEPAPERELIAADPEPAEVRSKPAPPPVEPPRPKPVAPQKIKQETLQFEPVTRGRFEKIEPTIVEGEDLDVPTFLRQNIKKR